MDLPARRARYTDLSNRLAQLDNERMSALLAASSPQRGWGHTHVIKLGPHRVFVKSIPITAPEMENPYSTANLYGLPTYYNYGVGSAGFGAFRELAAHVKTTNWVMNGEIANFPLMYHYRIVPTPRTPPDLDEDRHRRYVQYWGDDPNIDRYIRERNRAPHEAVLFLEYVPHVLGPWLTKNRGRWDAVIGEMMRAITFLRDRGMVHFDAHFWNILSDAERPYLTDFGLVLDKDFTLNAEERKFFHRHIDYDSAQFLSGVGSYIGVYYDRLPARRKAKLMRRYGMDADTGYVRRTTLRLVNVEEIRDEGLMDLDEDYVAQVVRHRDLTLLMQGFYAGLQANPKKDTPYPRAKVRRCLEETGFR